MSYVPKPEEIAKDIAALVDQSEHCGFCKHILHFFSYISTAFKQHRRYRGSTCGVVPNGRLYAIWELAMISVFRQMYLYEEPDHSPNFSHKPTEDEFYDKLNHS